MRDGRDTDDVLRALGAGRGSRIGVRVLPAAVGLLVRPRRRAGGRGSRCRRSDRSARSRACPASRSLAAPGAVVVPFVLGALAASVVVARRVRPGRDPSARAAAPAARPGSEGLRRAAAAPRSPTVSAAALAGGRAILLPGAAAVAVAAVVATAVFGANLERRDRHAPALRLALAGRRRSPGPATATPKTAAVRATLAHRRRRAVVGLARHRERVGGGTAGPGADRRAGRRPARSSPGGRPGARGEAVLGRADGRAPRCADRRPRADHHRRRGHRSRSGRRWSAPRSCPRSDSSCPTGPGSASARTSSSRPRTLRKDTSFTGVHLAAGVRAGGVPRVDPRAA